ncbi:MAG: flavodoxin family protein [Candidatus Helarchaeota archaeon]
MKVLAINGSYHENGNTYQLIQMVFEAIKEENSNIETELIQLKNKTINPCQVCLKCTKTRDNKCSQNDDLNDIVQKMIEADAIIIGTPTYFSNVSGPIKCLIDRAGFLGIVNGCFKRKLGAAVVAVRRMGAVHAFNSINILFTINQMIVVGSSYWNHGIGFTPGEVQKDKEGIKTMKNLGKNMAWLLGKIHT